MDWLVRGQEKRCDPQQVLPGARSVIVVALNYWQGSTPPMQIKEPRSPDRRKDDGGLETAAPW
jgi:epoxyqueuosine reductase QueG